MLFNGLTKLNYIIEIKKTKSFKRLTHKSDFKFTYNFIIKV